METLALTKREKQIGRPLALGATEKEIANFFNISQETVSNHKKRLYRKTGCHSVGQFCAWWFKTVYNIVDELEPFKTAVVFLFCGLTVVNEFNTQDQPTRLSKTRTARVKTGKRRNENTIEL